MEFLTLDEEKFLRKEVKKKLIDLDLTYADLGVKTGYSTSHINKALATDAKERMSRFLILAMCEALDLDIKEIRRKANGR